MADQIIWLPVPHCHSKPSNQWVECTIYVLNIRNGVTTQDTIWLRYKVDLFVLLDHYNNTDRYNKYSSQHTLA